MSRFQRPSQALRIAAVALLVPFGAAQAGPIDTSPIGAWRAGAYGSANVGPFPNGASGGLVMQLLNEWRPGELGYDYAAAPAGATKYISKLNVTSATSFLATIERRFSFTEHDPGDPDGLVAVLTGNTSIVVEVDYDDDYFAQVGTYAASNGASDSELASDGWVTGTEALAEADAAASAPGAIAVIPTLFWQSWAIFSATRFLVDDNPIPIFEEVTQWSRDANGNVTVVNLRADAIGAPSPGARYEADRDLAETLTVPTGTETLTIEQTMWGFLETRVELIPEPGTATLFALGLGSLVCGWRPRRIRH